MELQLVPGADAGALEAARRAAASAGVHPALSLERGRWWQWGIAESMAARAVTPGPAQCYVAAPSPRRTRGATRA